MHRTLDRLRGFVTLVALAAGLGAQSAEVRVELNSGRTFDGSVERADDDGLIVRTDVGPVRLRIADVSTITAHTREQPAVDGIAESREPEQFAKGTAAAGPDRELLRLLERYLWVLPSSEGHRTTVGAAALVVLTLLVSFAARMANIEDRSFGRASLFAIVVLAMLVVELTFVPASTPLLLAVAAFDFAAWLVLGIAVFRTQLFQGLVLLVGFVMSILVSVLLLQLAGVLIHADQMVG